MQQLGMGFDRLCSPNLKSAPKKCFFLRKSVKFLSHIMDVKGVSTGPYKVESVTNMTCTDLMEPDGVTPSQKRIRSFLGMINNYQQAFENLKSSLVHSVVLAHPDFTPPLFVVY